MKKNGFVAIRGVLESMLDQCTELNELYGDFYSCQAKDWMEDLLEFTNFGGRAKNAVLRDEVLLVAANSLSEK